MVACRILTSPTDIPTGDYVSEGLSIVMPDACFPNMVIGDKANHTWPYLRREIRHNWYCDRRAPEVGFLDRDEAILLHNLALLFRGKPALEVGSWMGWSTCHLALAGLALDVIDPVLADSKHAASIRASLAAAGVTENVRLYATASPDGVRDLAKLTGIKWHFFFIDGDHESPAPAQDALECMAHAARDAMIVFHDLTSPDVEEGLQVLWRHGWQVLVYQTMQIMGVAWQGEVQPVAHTPDPSVAWSLPLHLAKYPVSGSSPEGETRRLSQVIAWRDQEIEQLQEKLTSTSAELDQTRAAFAERDLQLGNLQSVLAARDGELAHLRTQIEEQETELAHLRTEADELQGLRNMLTTREAELAAQAMELARLEARGKTQEAELAHLRTEADELQGLRNMLTTREAELAAQAMELARLEARGKTQEAELAHLRTEADELQGLRNMLTTREAELGRVHVEVNSRDCQLHRLTFEVTRRSQEIERLSAEIERLQLTLDAVRSSVSWKITRPLRAIKSGGGILRRMSHRFVSEIGKEEKSLPPDMPRVLRLMRATRAVVPRSARHVLRSLRLLSPDQRRHRATVTLIASSRLFDPVFYCAHYPAVWESGLDPVMHYVVSGATDGLDPHPLFDTSFYCEGNPDVVQAGLNPLVHYLSHGAMEGRDPHPLFDTSFYCEGNPDVVQAGLNPLVHYLSHGAMEGRDPHPLFDTSFYCEGNPDVVQAGLNPLVHYLSHGAMEGRDPHPLFDTSFYCEGNPDVVQAGLNPLVHYLSHGAMEGRDPHPLFDTSFYLEQKPYVRELRVNPLVHFLAEGPTADFDPFSSTPPFPETGICIVTPDIVGPVKNGGIGTACYHFARVLAEAGQPVSVFFTGDVTDCQKAHWRNTYAKMRIKFIALSDAPPITRLVYGSSWFCERSWRVFEYLRQAQFSIVHFQDWQANGFWSIKAKRVGLAFEQTTLTVMTHSCTKWINEGMQQFSANPFETAKLVWVETYCMEHCDLLLSPSHHMLQWMDKNQIHMPSQTLLTPYPWTDGAATAPRVDGPVDSDHLIFFGRLETRKGLHIFGEALRQLQREGAALPRMVSFLGKHASVQGQPSTAYLEVLHTDLPAVDMRIINDFDYSHALDYIRQTRGLVVLPSIFDNYPLTVLECIQSGVPFIAANTGGIPEMIDARASFEPDPASLTACLKTRHAIYHGGLEHKYSASLAAKIWRDLHADLQAAQAPRGLGSPEQDTRRAARVSVCIPFFNHQQYLESLVTAFAHQSYPDVEVILVNDGSSPEASQEFERVATRSHNPRFRFLTTENCGPGAARNFAAEQATGDFLLFFDADNIPKGNDFIETLVRAIQHCQVDCVTCPYDIMNTDRIFVTEHDFIATYRPIGACIEAGFFENILGDATMIITHSAFTKLGGFPVRRSAWEDHEFLLNLCFKGFKLETFPEAVFYYRQSLRGRNHQANDFRNYQSLFGQLLEASTSDLARIIAMVSGPMLMAQSGSRPARLIAQ